MRHLGPVAREQEIFRCEISRITGYGNEKELYDRAAAKHAAAKHATHFLKQRWQQIAKLANLVSIRLLSLHLMRNYLGIGGSKDRFP